MVFTLHGSIIARFLCATRASNHRRIAEVTFNRPITTNQTDFMKAATMSGTAVTVLDYLSTKPTAVPIAFL